MYRMTAVLIGAATTIALVQPFGAVALEPSEVAALAKEFTVRIEGEQKGSGVIPERDGNTYTVLTNWHVVDEEGQYQVVTIDDRKHDVTYSKIRYYPGIDLAVLQFSSSQRYRTVKLGNSEETREGKTIYVIGWGDFQRDIRERPFYFWPGYVLSRLQKPVEGYGMVHDQPTVPTTYRGPVLDVRGRLVGINGAAFTEPNTGREMGLAIPMEIVLAGRNMLKHPPGIFLAKDVDVKPPEDVDINPRNAVSYYNRGVDYSRQGEYERAIADYNQAIRISPNYAHAYNNRGVIYNNQGEYERAIADYNQAIRINPNYSHAYNNRGLAYNNQGEYERAIADYNQAIRINPNYALAYNNRGVAYNNQGEYERAIASYDRAIQINRNWGSISITNAYNNRGVAYNNQGEYERAIADYNQAIRINPNYALAYNNRGLIYKELGDKRRAISDFQKAADLHRQQHGTDYIWYKRALERIRKLQGR
ncbi:MAG: serine protease [Hormoscilla sp. GM102CHS1]|nr:serine protease [Hormoscilla sp. GM102CHS1]